MFTNTLRSVKYNSCGLLCSCYPTRSTDFPYLILITSLQMQSIYGWSHEPNHQRVQRASRQQPIAKHARSIIRLHDNLSGNFGNDQVPYVRLPNSSRRTSFAMDPEPMLVSFPREKLESQCPWWTDQFVFTIFFSIRTFSLNQIKSVFVHAQILNRHQETICTQSLPYRPFHTL